MSALEEQIYYLAGELGFSYESVMSMPYSRRNRMVAKRDYRNRQSAQKSK